MRPIAAAGRQLAGELDAGSDKMAEPVDPVGIEVPGVGDVAGRIERGREAA
jgi:hypothetical protein